MPTIPTGKLERELRSLYLRWLARLDSQTDVAGYVNVFAMRANDVIERMGGQVASLGALGDFPTPKLLELSPRIGYIYDEMKQAAVAASIASGLSAKEAARAMVRAGMDKSYRKLERYARTETVSAYWKNAWNSIEGLDSLVMLWGSEDGPRTCEWCRERDGLVMASPDLRDHPNGRCTPIPTLKSQVKYRGSVDQDGSIFHDSDWNKSTKPIKPATLTAEELEAQYSDYASLNTLMQEKQQASVDYYREKAIAHGRDYLDSDLTYQAMRAELNLIFARMKVLKEAEDSAKRMARVGKHPKVDKLPTMPIPSSLDTAYAAGKANPKGRGWFDPNTGKVNSNLAGTLERDYQINCTRVAYATEMRMRGHNVTAAKAGDGANKSDVAIQANWIDPATGKTRSLRKTRSEAVLMKEMEKHPEGARFFVVGPWKGGGAHIWNAEKRNGRIVFHEGQVFSAYSGTDGLTTSYLADLDFERFAGTGGSVRFMRVDDLLPTDAGVTRGWLEVNGKETK
jgi:hypothetical protein